MKQAQVTASGEVIVTDVAAPQLAPGEVLVKSALVGICGSDTHAIAGGHPFLHPPYVPGHEAVGTVVQRGSQVDSVQVGTRVILKPNLTCGTCINCASGRTNACQNLAWIGCDPTGRHPGAMAEFFAAPAQNVYPIPEHITDEQAVLIECLATPVHAVSKAANLAGAGVVIIGAGTIGLLTLIAARHAGADNVVVLDLDQFKRSRATDWGARAAIDASSRDVPALVEDALGAKADIVFDCVAHAATIRQSLDMVRRAGSIMVVGVPPTEFVVDMPRIQDWEITLQGCAAYTERDVETSIAIAAEGKIPADAIITGSFELSAAAAAFSEAASNSSGKVVVSC